MLQSVLFAVGVAVAASLLLLLVPALLSRLGIAGNLTDGRTVRWWYSQPAIALASIVLSLFVSRRLLDSEPVADAAVLYVLCSVVVAIAAPVATWALLMALNFV